MKKIIFIALILITSQLMYAQTVNPFFSKESYPAIDTVKCHFLEVINDSTFEWKSGYVIRKSGYIAFDKTSVDPLYLPITCGIVTSKLFYLDMKPIKNYAIKVVKK